MINMYFVDQEAIYGVSASDEIVLPETQTGRKTNTLECCSRNQELN